LLSRKKRLPSPALVISVIALIAAVGGGTYALAISSQKTKQIARKVANKQINKREDGLQVGHASSADHADSADVAQVAGRAVSTSNNSDVPFDDGVDRTTVATLDIPDAGNYVINASLTAENQSSTQAAQLADCQLAIPGTSDDEQTAEFFDLPAQAPGGGGNAEPGSLQMAHTFDAPDSVVLRCRDLGIGNVVAKFSRITALQVARLNG
jgi:hypothetical protein